MLTLVCHVSPTLSLACAGIVLTNDGNAILREIDVTHPAAKVRKERERGFLDFPPSLPPPEKKKKNGLG